MWNDDFCGSSVTTNSNCSLKTCLAFKKGASSQTTAGTDLVVLAADLQTHCAECSSQQSRCFPASGNVAFSGYSSTPNSMAWKTVAGHFWVWEIKTEVDWAGFQCLEYLYWKIVGVGIVLWVSLCNTLPCINCPETGCFQSDVWKL